MNAKEIKIMKLSKVLMSSAVALSLVFGAVSCADEDDPNSMISGSNNNYSINYTNEVADTVSRGISKTAFKHAGAAIEITFQNPSTKPNGVMGFIFDLEETAGKKSFNVVGVRSKGGANLDYYVSRYENVSDLQAPNFGADESVPEASRATEVEYKTAFQSATGDVDSATNNVSVTAVALLTKAEAAGEDSKSASYTEGDWIYNVYLLKGAKVTMSDDGILTQDDALKTPVNLSELSPLAVIKTNYDKAKDSPEQKKLAVYANVYPNTDKCSAEYKAKGKATGSGTLKGTWQYKGDYKEVPLED